MATTTKLIATTLIFSLLILSPLAHACCSCTPTPVPVPPTPAAPVPVIPTPTPGPPMPKCPINVLKLGACADALGLVHTVLGKPPSGLPCCTLIKGLANLEAAACLCTVIKVNLLGNHLNIPVAVSTILSACQKTIPEGFKCPS